MLDEKNVMQLAEVSWNIRARASEKENKAILKQINWVAKTWQEINKEAADGNEFYGMMINAHIEQTKQFYTAYLILSSQWTKDR